MAKLTPDWEKIELEYRAGILSIREIASNHGITDGAIRKKAKAQDWVRDIANKVKAKAESIVRDKEVRTKVRTENKISECVLIKESASIVADVLLTHRDDILKLKEIKDRLAGELEVMPIGDENLLTGVKALKDLTDITAKLIDKEREAYNIKSVDKLDITSSDGSMTAKPTIIELVAPQFDNESTD